jgi:hypothetical protein
VAGQVEGDAAFAVLDLAEVGDAVEAAFGQFLQSHSGGLALEAQLRAVEGGDAGRGVRVLAGRHGGAFLRFRLADCEV